MIALQRSGLAQTRREDVAFYKAAHVAGKLNYRDIRKIGTPMSSEEKAALGGKYRGILTADFLATLTEDGLRDPASSAQMIAQPMSHLLHSAKALRSAKEEGIEKMKFRFGDTTAGHCAFSRMMSDKNVAIGVAQPLPAENCEHPDQCGCRWQSCTPLMDEPGL